jgi:hypothetical protein
VNGADALFVAHVLLDFCEVVGGRMEVGIVDDGEGVVDVLADKLIPHAFGALLSHSGEEEQKQDYRNHSVPSYKFQQI